MGYGLIGLVILVVVVAGVWKTFEKAGAPGWAALIPIFNLYIMVKIADREWWWVLLMLIPIVGFILGVIVAIDLAAKFGKTALYGVGLIFLGFIFWPMLGFGEAEYQGEPAGI